MAPVVGPDAVTIMRGVGWVSAARRVTHRSPGGLRRSAANPPYEEKQESGTPTNAVQQPPRLAARHRPRGGGSPVGVPPRHLRQRPNATAQLQPRDFRGLGRRARPDGSKDARVATPRSGQSGPLASPRALPAPSCPRPARLHPLTGHDAGRACPAEAARGAQVTSPCPREPHPLRHPVVRRMTILQVSGTGAFSSQRGGSSRNSAGLRLSL